MRTPNDIKLAEQCADIDLILGGHDHVYEIQKINSKYIVKSGTDFRQFSKITINFGNSESVEVAIEEVNVTASYSEDAKLKEELDGFTSKSVMRTNGMGAKCISALTLRRAREPSMQAYCSNQYHGGWRGCQNVVFFF